VLRHDGAGAVPLGANLLAPADRASVAGVDAPAEHPLEMHLACASRPAARPSRRASVIGPITTTKATTALPSQPLRWRPVLICSCSLKRVDA